MDIRPADAGRIHASPARYGASRPRLKRGIDVEGTIFEVEIRVGSLKMERRGQALVLKRQNCLNQPCHACGYVEMANIGLDRPDRAITFLVRGCPKGLGEACDFDRVA